MKIEQTKDHRAAQDFYTSVDYMSPIQETDLVLAAHENGDYLGIVRLALESNTLVLRGMMVAPSQQRKGLGTLMLKELEPLIGERDCYCVPHDWLEGFYGQIGFRQIDPQNAPQHLQERIAAYHIKYPHLIMMCRPA